MTHLISVDYTRHVLLFRKKQHKNQNLYNYMVISGFDLFFMCINQTAIV